ncbi:unnamed protein product [Heterobilharzia americana]|nr:unnamed protein product [Heterobilharzia americana]
MELDDYVISIVQIPPGHSSKTLLDTCNPQVEKFLKKFMKRLVKKPDTIFSRVLPTLDAGCDSFNLSVMDHRTTYIPYVIKATDSSWYLRQFPTYRLSIRSMNNDDKDCIILEQNKEKSGSNPLKRICSSRERSPQLITSSDEESGPPAKSRRIK